nr:Chaperone protein ClpB [Leptospira interrogans serovar Copenhageni/Icterohaemorrhagiae]
MKQIKEEIEKYKNLEAEAERRGEINRVAEIRYGKLVDLQKELESANEELKKTRKCFQTFKRRSLRRGYSEYSLSLDWNSSF